MPHQLHIPSSVSCPPEFDPHPKMPAVPYATALKKMRENRQLMLLPDCAELFSWVEQDNNSAYIKKLHEGNKQLTLSYYYLYFRIRVPGYENILKSLAKLNKFENVYSEDKLKKWTVAFRFRIKKISPLKIAINAFLCRMGIENEQNIVFCRDGFYGDCSSGSISSATGVPHEMVLGNSSAFACGLTNGSSIFVSRTNATEREAAVLVLQTLAVGSEDDTASVSYVQGAD